MDRIIHEHGIRLSEKEREILVAYAWTQDQKIGKIFQNRPARGFTFYEIVQATGFNQDSVKRSISNMAGSGDIDRYKDDHRRFPLIKSDDKRLNPDTGIKISVYRWNPRYGKPLSHTEIVQKQRDQKQMNFHEELFN